MTSSADDPARGGSTPGVAGPGPSREASAPEPERPTADRPAPDDVQPTEVLPDLRAAAERLRAAAAGGSVDHQRTEVLPDLRGATPDPALGAGAVAGDQQRTEVLPGVVGGPAGSAAAVGAVPADQQRTEVLPDLRAAAVPTFTAPSRVAAGPAIEASPAGAAGPAVADDGLEVDDGAPAGRIRRPSDVLRLGGALGSAVLLLVLAAVAGATVEGVDQDVSDAVRRIPTLISGLLGIVSLVGSLTLFIAVSIVLLVGRRPLRLLESLGAALVALVVLGAVNTALLAWAGPGMLAALRGAAVPASSPPLDNGPALIITLAAVSRLGDRRRWRVAFALVIVAGSTVAFLLQVGTVLGTLLSLLLGWAVGLAFRYGIGSTSARPTGREIAAALASVGRPLRRLVYVDDEHPERRYHAVTTDGQALDLVVLDRDLEGTGAVIQAWRGLRLRHADAAGFDLRAETSRRALMGYAAGQTAAGHVPRLLAVCEVGQDAAALAYEGVVGPTFADLVPAVNGPDSPDEAPPIDPATGLPLAPVDGEPPPGAENLSDADLAGAWAAVTALHAGQVAHGRLAASAFRRTATGVVLDPPDRGAVAAGDVVRRIDDAELLCTLALLAGAERVIAVSRACLGDDRLVRALPALQPVAFTEETRAGLKRRPDVVPALQRRIMEFAPAEVVAPLSLERMRPRVVLGVVAGTVAGYLLLSQLTTVDLPGLLRTASWGWALVALGFSFLTYVSAAYALEGFVPAPLPLGRTLAVQFAATFASLVAPPAVSGVAVNLRYLQRQGVPPAVAAASVGLSQSLAFASHTVLLLSFGLLAGSQQHLSFRPSPTVGWALFGVLVAGALLLTVPAVRARVVRQVRLLGRSIVPALTSLARRPAKLGRGVGALVGLNAFYIAALAASVQAFGGGLALPAVAVVYLAGSVVGAAAPTPGGLGAVEAAMVAGLTAAGLSSDIAIPAVLLFRVVTYWLPTIPGWACFAWLQRRDAL